MIRSSAKGSILMAAALSILLAVGYVALAASETAEPPPDLQLVSAELEHDPFGRLTAILTGAGLDEECRFTLSLDVANRSALVASLQTWSSLQDVAVSGQYAYLANSYRGLQIADISDPERPRIIGSLKTHGKIWDIVVKGSWVFASDTDEGLLVIDVGDPTAPELVSRIPAGRTMSLALYRDFAYVTDFSGELHVIDVQVPDQPKVIGSVDTGMPLWKIAIDEGLAYLTSHRGGLQVYDLSNPAEPSLRSTLSQPEGMIAARVQEDTAYVTTTDKRLLAIDVANSFPRILGQLQLPSFATDIALNGNRLYLAAATSGTLEVDITDPVRLHVVGRISTGNDRGVVLSGNLAFVAGSSEGLKIFDLRSDLTPQRLARIDTEGLATALTVVGDTAYLADGPGGIKAFDLSDPFQPRLLGTFDTPGYAWDLVLDKGWAYVADGWEGLRIVDVNDPEKMWSPGALQTSTEVRKVAVEGGRAYIIEHTSVDDEGKGNSPYRLSSIDLSRPESPRLEASFETSLRPRDLTVVNGRALVANLLDGVRILEGDGGELHLISAATLPWPQQVFAAAMGVTARDAMAYVANGRAGFQTVDVSDPGSPRILSNLTLPGYHHRVKVYGDRAFLLSRRDVYMVDISQTTESRLTGRLSLPHPANDIAVAEGVVYVADGEEGILVLPLPMEGEALPNRRPHRVSVLFDPPPVAGRYLLQAFSPQGHAVIAEGIEYHPPSRREDFR